MDTEMQILLDKASNKLETLLELKSFAIKIGNYELSAKCRDIELKKFPVSQEEINALKEADSLDLLFRMVELNISKDVAYRIARAFELYKKKKGGFNTKDASKIVVDSKRLFLRK